MWKKVKLLKMSNFTFFHIVFYAICILKSFNSHISVVVRKFFQFGMASKWCIREWINQMLFMVNSLPNDKILDMTKLKAFTDNKINVAQIMISVFDRVENIVEKRRKCWLTAFSPFTTMFSKGFFHGVVKSWVVWLRVKLQHTILLNHIHKQPWIFSPDTMKEGFWKYCRKGRVPASAPFPTRFSN